MYVTLRQLTYFQALAKEGNFGRAALACRVSQPALSMHPQCTWLQPWTSS